MAALEGGSGVKGKLIKLHSFIHSINLFLYSFLLKAQQISSKDKEGVTFRASTPYSRIHVELENSGVDTMEKTFAYAVRRNGTKRCLGTRQLFAEEEEMQKNGKLFKKYALGDYVWHSYNEADRMAESFGKGLRELGLQPKDRICIFAETRAEWLVAAIGAFKQNLASEFF
jgi:long-chain acyl-CoA synthetase